MSGVEVVFNGLDTFIAQGVLNKFLPSSNGDDGAQIREQLLIN
jgi:hypothetical protein